MAPSTPPPPSKLRFAALTMASTASVVMSAMQTSSRAAPTTAVTSGETVGMPADMTANLSHPLRLRLGAQIDRAFYPDIVKMLVEEPARRALPADVEHVEKIVIGRKLAECVEVRAEAIEHDAVNVDAAILSRPDAARQLALIDQARHEVDGAIFADQRRVECDFVNTVHDLARRHRRRLSNQRIDLNHKHVFRCCRAEERKDNRIAEITAVPIGYAIDFDSAKQQRQTGRRHNRIGRDF